MVRSRGASAKQRAMSGPATMLGHQANNAKRAKKKASKKRAAEEEAEARGEAPPVTESESKAWDNAMDRHSNDAAAVMHALEPGHKLKHNFFKSRQQLEDTARRTAKTTRSARARTTLRRA